MQRKTDVRKGWITRGWELLLSHDFRTGITSGFCKGSPSSDIVQSIGLLKGAGLEISHPLLLPLIIFSLDASFKVESKQRDARDWLRRLEHAISMHSESDERQGYVKEGIVDLDAVNRDLVECHAQVLWKQPVAYLPIIDSFKEAIGLFYNGIPEDRKNMRMKKTQVGMLSRLEFYKKRWEGVETYANTTLARLETQKGAVRSYAPLSVVTH